MADLSAKQTAELRAEIKKRFDVEIDHKIFRVEFIDKDGFRSKFSAEDDFEEPAPPEQPKDVLELHIYDTAEDTEPSVIPSGSMMRLLDNFRTYQKLNKHRIVAMCNGVAIQTWPK